MGRVSDRAAYAVLLVIGVLCIITFLVVRVPRAIENRVLTTDGVGYFSYLRSLAFDHDLDFHNEYAQLWRETEYTPGALDVPLTGLARNMYSIGLTVLWAPFYLLAHAISLLASLAGAQVDTDGYGLVYQSAVSISTIVYVTVGCFLTYRLCRKYFAPSISLLAVSGVWLASSLLHYTVAAPDMSHGISFFAVSLFVFVWHPPRSRTHKEWAALGLIAGLMTLVRWQDLLYLSVLAVEAIQATIEGRRRRLAILREYLTGAIVAGLVAMVVFSPQMLAWNTLYGSPIGLPLGDYFDWLHPSLLEYLFSTRHGLYTWTPIALLATVGLVPLWRRHRKVTLALVVALLAHWYLNSATYNWWSDGSFGARRFVSATPLLAIGLAALTDHVAHRFRRGHIVMLGTVSALVVWNLLFELQYSWGFIPRDQAISLHELTVGKLEMVVELLRRLVNKL